MSGEVAGIALVEWSRGATLTAARLLARGEALHREMGYTHTDKAMAMHQEMTRPLRGARADPAVDAAWLEGEAMTLEEALAEASAVERRPDVARVAPANSARSSCVRGMTISSLGPRYGATVKPMWALARDSR